nr:MAG TPA: hypothetical protein [Caudoviricetes sp.]
MLFTLAGRAAVKGGSFCILYFLYKILAGI